MQASVQANKFASAIDHTAKIKNFTKHRTGKFLFSQGSKETCYLFLCLSKGMVYQENISLVKTIHMYAFIKGIRKTNCYRHMHFFLVSIKLVNIINNNFEHVLYPLHIESKDKKII